MAAPENRNFIWEFLSSFNKQSEEVTLLDFLRSIVFFRGLTPRQLQTIMPVLHQRTYQEGEFFFEYEHPGACLFIIQDGEVAVESPNQKGEMQFITKLYPGTFLGELALLDQSPRTASVRATKKTQALALFRDDLNELVKTEPDIACEIYRSLSTVIGKRLVETTKVITQTKQKDKP